MIDPRGMTLYQWTDFMQPALSKFGLIPILLDEMRWREWGAQVIQLPGIAALNPPIPQAFSSWMDWAFRFNQALDRG